jgi:hypothetical protein
MLTPKRLDQHSSELHDWANRLMWSAQSHEEVHGACDLTRTALEIATNARRAANEIDLETMIRTRTVTLT